jgi:cob(I)alamin adenosyltransferase
MKIYTRTGDDGTTSLFGGKRVSKSDVRIESYGTVDELNSFIGLVRDQEVNHKRKETLVAIQDRLFVIGSMLAVEPGNTKVKIPTITAEDVAFLEQEIDQMEDQLTPLRNFILPGGHPSVSYCHIARTVCRKAERTVIALSTQDDVNPLLINYLNRLSDFLFVLARMNAKELGAEETPWKPNL